MSVRLQSRHETIWADALESVEQAEAEEEWLFPPEVGWEWVGGWVSGWCSSWRRRLLLLLLLLLLLILLLGQMVVPVSGET